MKTEEAVNFLKRKESEWVLHETLFHGEVTIEVDKKNLISILQVLKDEAGFEVLMDLTAVDYLYPKPRTKLVYLLHNPTNYARIRLVFFTNREEPIPSVIALWKGAEWYERELYDLFGVYFDGQPDIKRLLMPDNWIGHPLRKDYPLTEEPVQFKHGVTPKIPSEIISHVPSKERI